MNFSTINWLAVIVATISSFAIGGLWYSPVLFGNIWMKEVKMDKDAKVSKGTMFKIFGLTFVFSFIIAVNLAMFLNDPKTTASWGAAAGFLAGFGWATMSIFILTLFENRSWKYRLIHAGYTTVTYVLMGLIIGAWR
ncbi:MAG: hypothetical protein HW421_2740 [Ignavibacteria bacterium]|nr:hypothetical protein [Ignavibacteria bacterium]